ncbi:putative GTPase activating protein for Arf [Leishmania braziliensis]|nr:putative GTPase activating protein for Arf [Leishmania braziliensis]
MSVLDRSKEKQHRKSKEHSVGDGRHHHHHHSHDKKKSRKNTANADSSTSLITTLPAHQHCGIDVDEDDEDWEENRVAVERLCAQYPNNICADCGETGTRWASVNHGVFVCIRCSGVHRSLGVHISKIKSTNMDRWSLAEVRLMKAIGNVAAKALYEAHLPAGARPSSGAGATADEAVKLFIERKYAQREFAMHNLKDVLERHYKDTGYRRSKTAFKSRAAVDGVVSLPTGESRAAAVSVDRAVMTGKRGDTMRALYGDAAAEMQRGLSRRTKNAASQTQGPMPKLTYGTFGIVNVPPEEYEARWQRTVAVFTFVEAPPAAVAAPAEEAPRGDEGEKETRTAAPTPLTEPTAALADRPQMDGVETTPATVSSPSLPV